MSAVTPRCDRCNLDRTFVRVAPIGNQTNYGVEWRCPHCDDHLLDICPIGPLIPSADTCLNCGEPIINPDRFAACTGCDLTPQQARASLGIDPFPADPVTAAGKLFDTGLIRRALGTINQALIENPSLEAAWQVKYSFLSGLGIHEAALSVIKAAGLHSSNPELLIAAGIELQGLNRHAEAVDVYQQYLTAAPHGEFAGVALCNCANSLRATNADAPAENFYRQAIARDPKTPSHYANYVRLLLDQKRFADAHGWIDKGWACAKEPAMVSQFLEDKAAAFAEQMRGEDSLKCADAAIAQSPDRVRGRYLRGRALALLGRLSEARQAMQTVLKLDPKNADARRALTMIDEAVK